MHIRLEQNEYNVRSFVFGPFTIDVLCLQSSSTDYDLTGQLIWPGTSLLNDYIINHSELFESSSVIELGAGVGLTGLLSGHVCRKVVMTDHNDTVLKVMKRNIELQQSRSTSGFRNVTCEKLEWGSISHLNDISQKHPDGFDMVFGADICYQQNSIGPLFDTVRHLLEHQGSRICEFILAYISRAKSTDVAIFVESERQGLVMHEVPGTRRLIDEVYEGVVYKFTLETNHRAL